MLGTSLGLYSCKKEIATPHRGLYSLDIGVLYQLENGFYVGYMCPLGISVLQEPFNRLTPWVSIIAHTRIHVYHITADESAAALTLRHQFLHLFGLILNPAVT